MEINETMVSMFTGRGDGQYRELCPSCSYRRKPANQKEKVLSVRVEYPDVQWNCHHCGEQGGANLEPKREKVVKFVPPKSTSITNRASDYLRNRGLSDETIASGRVMSAIKYFPKLGEERLGVGFPYVEAGTDSVYAVKFRSVEDEEAQGKGLTQEGAARSFYGIERVKIGEPIVICEGEVDCLSVREAGI